MKRIVGLGKIFVLSVPLVFLSRILSGLVEQQEETNGYLGRAARTSQATAIA